MVIGLACRVEGGQPVVGIVRLYQLTPEPRVETFRIIPLRHHDRAQQLLNLGADLETQLKDEKPSAIVVRTVEAWGGGQRTPHEPSTRVRLWVEGVLLSVARRYTDDVRALTGQAIGQACGRSKAEVEGQARTLVELKPELVDAGAAALAGLALVERG